jgi:hypothetical protein
MLPLVLVLAFPAAEPIRTDRFADAPKIAARIDDLLSRHWQTKGVEPAAPADDATFLRRITLDLAGRIPTRAEAMALAQDRSPDRRTQVVRRLMEGTEYALNFGRVLDDAIQGKYAGDADFVEYLRLAVAQHRPWDAMFRDIMLGPWDTLDRKRADRFLSRRQKDLDEVTNDTARVFFGVNVSCARCHDHPLVADWTQDHYYGMASFFVRTAEAAKGKQRNAEVSEKPAPDVMFVTTKGERRTAKVMFLNGRSATTSTDKSRREQLVNVALEEKSFFSRAIVNRLWAHLMGRGLVHPLDQMHSANPPSVPGVLEWLADDLTTHGYELDRLVAGIVFSRVYQLSSLKPAGEAPDEKHFAQALLRPLTPQQLALSLLIATGDGSLDEARTPEVRAKKYRELEGQASALAKPGILDGRAERYQAGTGEALFLSNNAGVQKLLAPTGKNLVARLAAMSDNAAIVETAVSTVLGRAPAADERAYLTGWIAAQKGGRATACGELVWALATSAEFRFNH